MKALFIVAHGSRREASNNEVRALTQEVARLCEKGEYQQVSCGFLELAEPLIPDGISELIESGADEVVVLPYFLSAGRHVAEDIPEEVAKARAKHPDAQITIAPYLGGHSLMANWLSTTATQTSKSH